MTGLRNSSRQVEADRSTKRMTSDNEVATVRMRLLEHEEETSGRRRFTVC